MANKAKTITNPSEFISIGLFINTDHVKNAAWKERLLKRKSVHSNPKVRLINARAFNYNDLMIHLSEILEMDLNLLLNIKYKTFENKLGWFLVDLTSTKDLQKGVVVHDNVQLLREELHQFVKQTPDFNPNAANILLETRVNDVFETFKALDKCYTKDTTFLHNTGHIVASNPKFANELYISNENKVKRLLSTMGHLPYKAIEGKLESSMYDDIVTCNNVYHNEIASLNKRNYVPTTITTKK